LVCKSINIWGCDVGFPVISQRLVAQLVGKKEDDVWPFIVAFFFLV
jgi:hypothetical protein